MREWVDQAAGESIRGGEGLNGGGLKEQGLSQDGGEYRSGLGRQEGGRVPP